MSQTAKELSTPYTVDDSDPAAAWRTIARTIASKDMRYTREELIYLAKFRRDAGDLPVGLDRLGANAIIITSVALHMHDGDSRSALKRITDGFAPGAGNKFAEKLAAALRKYGESDQAEALEQNRKKWLLWFKAGMGQLEAFNQLTGSWFSAMVHWNLHTAPKRSSPTLSRKLIARYEKNRRYKKRRNL